MNHAFSLGTDALLRWGHGNVTLTGWGQVAIWFIIYIAARWFTK